jgi:hypothetical protein
MRWIVNKTKVATQAGNNARFPELEHTTSGWIDGTLVEFDETLGVELPYKTMGVLADSVLVHFRSRNDRIVRNLARV